MLKHCYRQKGDKRNSLLSGPPHTQLCKLNHVKKKKYQALQRAMHREQHGDETHQSADITHLRGEGGVRVVRGSEVGHLLHQPIEFLILAVGVLQVPGLVGLKLRLQLLNVADGGADEALLKVFQGVVHPVVERLERERGGEW